MSGNLTLDALRAPAANAEIDTVLVCQVDMQGRLMGKRFHVSDFLEYAIDGTQSCKYVFATDLEMHTVEGYASVNWKSGYGDYTLKPDLSTLRHAPWLDSTALILCDTQDQGGKQLVPHAPRTLLKQQLKRLADHGLQALFATELEFFLFRDTFEAADTQNYQDLTLVSSYNEDYAIFQTTKEEGVMRAIRNGLIGANIPVECSKGEAAAGQAELNIRYLEALATADNHAIAKNACKEIAWAKGHALTFLAKWNANTSGSSAHIHQSLRSVKGNQPVFFDPDGRYGMSKLMESYVAGQLNHASSLTALMAPYVNSYKRFVPGTFAPTRIVWSPDNRTACFRICGENTPAVRVECRMGGSDMNPHLAFAALIAAGLDGIERNLPLPDPHKGDAYEAAQDVQSLPDTLRAATDLLNQSDMLRCAFGDDVIDHYVHAARWEQEHFDRAVTDYEIRRGFERA